VCCDSLLVWLCCKPLETMLTALVPALLSNLQLYALCLFAACAISFT
jgi:hypothetical protein